MNKKLKKMLCLGLCMLLTVGTLLMAENAQAASAYSFKYKGVTATPGKSAKKLIKKAGKIKSYTKQKNNPTKEYYKCYEFKYFTVETISTSSKKSKPGNISIISFTSSKVKTAEGIKIGSSEKSMIKKYGKGNSEKDGSNTYYTYIKGTTVLSISVKKGKVTGISYGDATEVFG